MGKVVERISMGLGGVEANGFSQNAVMTKDGRYIVYESTASNLVADDINGASDIFRYDTHTGETIRVSLGNGNGEANGASSNASVTADGRYVVFDSTADNLVADDTNGLRDVFMRDIETGVTTRISETLTGIPSTAQAQGGPEGSYHATVTTIGGFTYVAFVSDATNLVFDDTNGVRDIFLRVVETGAVFRISNADGGAQSTVAADPHVSIDSISGLILLAFSSHDPNLTANDGSSLGSVFLTDGEYASLVSVQTANSVQTPGDSYDANLVYPYIVYTNTDPNIGVSNVYAYNHQTQVRTLVSVGFDGSAANGDSGFNARVAIADDNTPWVAFTSAASNLVEGDTNGQIDFFVKNLVTGQIIRLSDPGNGDEANGTSSGFATGGTNFSINGKTFVFLSDATNMVTGDTNGFGDIFRVLLENQSSEVTASAGTTIATEQVMGVIDADLTVTDADNARPVQAMVQITGNYVQGQDVLQFTTIGTITGTFDTATGALTLSGWGTMAEYQAALRAVTYLNTSDAPDVGNRIISFTVDDGGGWSTAGTKTVSITAVNDGPAGIFLSGSSVQEARAANTVVGTLSTVDPDGGGTFTYTLLDDADGRFVVVGNQLRVADGVLLDFEQQTSHQVQIRVTDNGGLTHTETITIAVTDVNPETVTGNDKANTIVGGAGNDNLSGLGGIDTLIGNAGNDTLNGGADLVLDVLIGGQGNDTYVLGASTNDVVVETDGNSNGIDTVTSTTTRALTGQLASIENLTLLGGTAAINGTGNGMINVLTGNEGINVLDGGALGDTLNGNGGNDVFLYAGQADFTGDTVNGGTGVDRIRFTSTTATETLTLSNKVALVEVVEIANAAGSTTGTTALNINAAAMTAGMQLIGNNGANTIIGTRFADTITGNAGNDTLDGGAGTVADTLIGGAGNDTYVLGASTNDVVVETGGNFNGIDTVTSTVTRALTGQLASIENLTLLGGTAAINGTGNGMINILTGNEGVNVLDGGALGDTLIGNGGNDIFLYARQSDFTGDTVNGGTGLDRIRFTSTLANETLVLSNKVTQVEIAEIANAAGVTTGTTALNLNATAVTAGMQLIGNNGINTIIGTNFADTITGNAGNDTLRGMGGIDTILGGIGNDNLFGGLGNDKLDGGAGLDSFYFDTALNKTSNVDTITGFVVADDTIRLDKAIFTALSIGTLSFGAFAKNLTGVATEADDRLIYEADTGKLFYDANGVGGAAGIHFATVGTNLLLTNADFIVY